jgi:erythromycin esterase-like protein
MGKNILLGIACQVLSVCVVAYSCTPAGENRPGQDTSRPAVKSGDSAALAALVRAAAHPFKGAARDYDPLMDLVGDARFVLLGEATHGTHEFYRERARITRRLVEEKGFGAVVLEADWPDAHRVNEYVRGRGKDETAEQALSGFKRFPRWMWRNTDFRDFVVWLRAHNDARPPEARVGVYGMDLYSVEDSAAAVKEYLKRVDPEAARVAGKRYGCLAGYRREGLQQYGLEVATRARGSCEKDVTAQWQEMERRLAARSTGPGSGLDEELLSAYQNARVVKNGETYFRGLYYQKFSTWNLRDSHMVDTIHALAQHLPAPGGAKAKVVVWAHNTHQGDARMTEQGEKGELNVGHLMRRFHDGGTVLVGFTTYAGEVMAADEWGAAGRKMKVRPALPESFSGLFHATGVHAFLLTLRGEGEAALALAEPRLERAIGVVYLPATERRSHYFEARMSKQFDAVIHLDMTSAVTPLK